MPGTLCALPARAAKARLGPSELGGRTSSVLQTVQPLNIAGMPSPLPPKLSLAVSPG